MHALLSWSLSGEFRSLGGQILVADDDDASCHACAVSIYYLYMMMRHPINKIALTGLHSFLVNEYSSSRTRMTEAAMRKRASKIYTSTIAESSLFNMCHADAVMRGS